MTEIENIRIVIPAERLRRGRNEIVVLELEPGRRRSVQGLTDPVFGTPPLRVSCPWARTPAFAGVRACTCMSAVPGSHPIRRRH